MIPLAKPWLDEREQELVAEVLRSGALIQGARVAEFEAALAKRLQRKYAIAVSNGTTALWLALRAIDVGAGDEVLCPALSWPSPANAVALLGAKPILIDVDEAEWNSLPEHFARARSSKTKAAIVIDQLGNPAQLDAIAQALPGISLIEDAACALGSTYDQRPCGSFGVVSCISFHPRKIITTGEGGLCATDDPKIAASLQSLRNHGQEAPGKFREVSGNFRLTDVAGALGLAQLEKLDKILAHRTHMVARYQTHLSDWKFQRVPARGSSNFQTVGAIPPARKQDVRDATWWLQKSVEKQVQLGRLSVDMGSIGTLPLPNWPLNVSQRLAAQGVALPMYAQMTESDQDQVIRVLQELQA